MLLFAWCCSRSDQPVGHLFVLHLSDWMHPSAKSMARAAEHVSAPSASVLTTLKPVTILPAAVMRTSSRRPAPRRRPCTSVRPSAIGMPTLFENSARGNVGGDGHAG